MDELGVLRELNKSLTSNQEEWKLRVSVAEEKLAKTEKTYSGWIGKLEKKVFTLMEKLDMNVTGTGSGELRNTNAPSSSGNIGAIVGDVGDDDDDGTKREIDG
jgi:hypothetical protein